jgi:hypothetical protein
VILVPIENDWLRALARIHQRPKERNGNSRGRRFLLSFLRGGGLFKL